MKYCNNCGNRLNDAVKFCPACGAKQPDASSDRGGIEVIPTAEEPDNKKKKIILISSIIGAAVVMILAGVICLMFLFGKKGSDPEPTTTEVTTTEKATTEKSTTEKSTTEEPTTEDPVELENIAAIEAYHDVISGIVSGAVTYSSDRIACINENDSSEYLVYNNYAIDDFDSDGVAEMMLYMECNASSSPMASSAAYGSRFEFYEYNANRDSAELIHNVNGCCEVNSGDSLVFYNNGVIEIEDQQFETDNDGGIFLCVNTDIFDLIESGYDYDDDLEYNEDGESWAFLIYIYKLDDGTYSMQFVDNISTPYVYGLSETEGKELLDKLRDTGTINAEVNDFNLEDLADVCGFDYDEAVAEIEANTEFWDNTSGEDSSTGSQNINQELTVYLGTDMQDFVNMFDDMSMDETFNDYLLIASIEDDPTVIYEIDIRDACEYCLYGVYYGMDVDNVLDTIEENGGDIENKFYREDNNLIELVHVVFGFDMYITYDSNNKVDSVSVFPHKFMPYP